MKHFMCLTALLLALTVSSTAQWAQTGTPPYGDVRALAVSGTNLFAATNSGIFRSTNNGAIWTSVGLGLTSTNVLAFAVIGTNLFAGTNGGVFLSTNNGANWSAASSGIPNAANVFTFAVNGNNLFAGTDSGVFLSTNNGSIWSAAKSGLTKRPVFALTFNGQSLFAGTDGGGVYLSTNNGSTWTAVNSGLVDPYVRALVVNGSTLFAGTYYSPGTYNGGIFISTDNGTGWTALSSGVTNTIVQAFAVIGINLFAGTPGGGVYLSTNIGTSWTSVNTSLLSTTNVYTFAANSTYLFIGTNGGVWRRPLSEMVSLIVPPAPPLLSSPTASATGISINPTLSWNGSVSATSYHLQVSTTSSFSSTVVDQSGIVGMSQTIGGLSASTHYFWRVSASNLGGTSVFSDTWDFRTALAPSTPSLVYPSQFSSGILTNPTFIWSVSAGASSYRLQVSSNPTFTPIVVDQGGIEGTSYTAVGLTYNTLHYWRLVASGLGGASNWSDVWSFTTVGVTSVEEGIPSVPKAYVLSQSYPNPFNPTTTIQFELPQRGYVTLRVFDLLGKEVACLVSEALGPGSYKARWQADVPSGTYIYRLQAGEYVGTRKMVLVR